MHNNGVGRTGQSLNSAAGVRLRLAMARKFFLHNTDDYATIDEIDTEPPRLYRRLHTLRRWSYENRNKIFPGNTGTRSAHGAGTAKGTLLTEGHDLYHFVVLSH